MMRSVQPKGAVIGLDIGKSAIKAVQVSRLDKAPRMDGFIQLRRTAAGQPLERDEARLLLRAMERQGMTGSCVVLTAPTDALVGGSLSVPPADSGVAREKIVEMELSRTHKLTPGSFEMAWWDLPLPSSGSRIGQVHALALPHSAVEASLHVLSELGLGVVRTVPGSLALLAAAQRYPIDPRCVSAVIDLGSTRGHLSLMVAGRVVHERALPDFNMHQICQDAGELLGVGRPVASYALGRFGIDEAPEGMVACDTAALIGAALDPLAEEIGMSFSYVSHLYPEAELGQLLLCGGGAKLPGLPKALSILLELETAVITPGALLQGDGSGQEHDDPRLTQAAGAALCGKVCS